MKERGEGALATKASITPCILSKSGRKVLIGRDVQHEASCKLQFGNWTHKCMLMATALAFVIKLAFNTRTPAGICNNRFI